MPTARGTLPGVKVASWRWWFENRKTGAITVAQFPNWPLFAIGLGWVAQAATVSGSRSNRLASAAVIALWLFWGSDEIVRGVNPWRRLLGAGVVIWQLVQLLVR